MRIIKLILVAALVAIGGCQSTAPQIAYDYQTHPAADINVRLGAAYIREGRLELALVKLRKALAIDPNLPSANYTVAIVYQKIGEYELADRHFQHALSINPNDAEAHNNYGAFLCERGSPKEAEREFLAALANTRYQTPELAYVNAGQCAHRSGDYAKAETYLRKALKINPNLRPALYYMSELSFSAERHLSARAYLQRYMEIATHSPESLWLGIRIERVLGDQNTAASYAIQLKAQFPDSTQTQALYESEQRGE